MSPYERRIPQELVRTFINEIRSSKYFIDSSNSLISNFRNMGISSLKMSFVWLFETIRESKSTLNILSELDYLRFKKLRNWVVHNPNDWDRDEILIDILDYTLEIERIYLNV
jgi:hypothetical protein